MSNEEASQLTKRTRYEMLRSRVVKERRLFGATELEIERAVRSELDRLKKLRINHVNNALNQNRR
jgi:hypothetical protein